MRTMLMTPPPVVLAAVGRFRGLLDRLHTLTAPSHIAVLELSLGSWFTAALYATVRLGIADALADGPLRADDVARKVGADPEATYRLMRALASRSVLKLRRDGRFALTRLGHALRVDHPESMAPLIAFVGSRQHWEHWGELLYSVQTGRTAVEKLRGSEFFEYLDTDPAFAKVFNESMTGGSRAVIENAIPAYDFSDRRLIVDVGGGEGGLLAAILNRTPTARGVLFDRPSVVAGADSVLGRAGVAARCRTEGGSFFEAVPAGGDAYVMKAIIHDWGDDQSLSILRNVRTAIADDGRLLLFEMVLPERAPAHLGFMVDLEMLVTAGGRERTASQYAKLLADSGFRMTRVIPTASPLSIVEAVPA
ncbi:methyltransferase [Mycolicibacterium austroafricanum]|uniref:methyltransferase n=1 Tax=Mycolicibacterium austroafricanum TaxID=39687 RepID=UPI000CFA3EBA|nr:methyltransferase [Mycolicibacterium austroafricanum]PQP42999.1 hydroxyneurosporene methyltransferase [Mycolicibacterium austroafricanum]